MLAHHVKEPKCTSASVGGYSDPVHLLLSLSRTLTIAKLVEDVKTETSKWAKHHKDGSSVFSWQSGYRAFSVSHSLMATVDQCSPQSDRTPREADIPGRVSTNL